MTRPARILLAALPLLAPAAALAQAQTGTGGGPGTTITAPNTSSVGQTMPPSGRAGASADSNLDRRTPEQRSDDKISRGICIGCGPK